MNARLPAWMTLLAVLSFAALGTVAVLLWLRYDELPEKYPTHYGISGQPDAFGARKPGRVFGPSVLGLLSASLLWFNVWAVAHGMRPGSPRRQRLAMRMLAVVAALTSSLIALASAAPLTRENAIPGGPWIMLAFTLGVLATVVVGIIRWRRSEDNGDTTPAECWHAGMIYYNRADPALMVERRDGMGVTANFAHPLAWVYPVSLVAIFGVIYWMVS